MRKLPEPDGQLAWQTYTRDKVLAIQKQAYEDGLKDAVPDGYVLVKIQPTEAMLYPGPLPKNEAEKFAADMAAGYRKEIWASMLTASQKPRCDLCGYQHGHAIGCANNPVDITLKAASQEKQK